MYERFYGLTENPFTVTPDTKYLFLGAKHKEALASLLYGINDRKGFILIAGEIGSGKTTLCRALCTHLNTETTRIALIFNSFLTELELLKQINDEFSIPSHHDTKKALIDELNRFLIEEHQKRHNAVLIIDEAQNLSLEVLEQIRMLGNLETEKEKLLQIVLMGQPELSAKLDLPHLEQLNQRIAVRFHLTALSKEEMILYMQHRLEIASAKSDITFTTGAIDAIYDYSKGVPRKINILCDRTLLGGYVKSTYTIDDAIVRDAILELLGVKSEIRKQAIAQIQSKFANVAIKFAYVLAAIVFMTATIQIGVIFAKATLSRPIVASNNHTIQEETSDTTISTAGLTSNPQENTIEKTPDDKLDQENQVKGNLPDPEPERTYDWEYDENGIVRVPHPEYAYPAAVMTWLALWNKRISNLAQFRNYTDDQIQAFSLVTRDSPLGLHKVSSALPLEHIIAFGFPVIITFRESAEDVSPYVVLVGINSDRARIADPLKGIRDTSLNDLKAQCEKTEMLYFDTVGFEQIQNGEKSERVHQLQTLLKDKGLFKGQTTGAFNDTTVESLKAFQRRFALEPTGKIEGETAMLVATFMQSWTPRLMMEEESER